ncbi:calcium/sodium antiporter [Legionella yabuuchiae]|uniref:calcium/sodium antiporter n=1 Tax=Legionella yabuuchiae TaxID=376727 RepID=UPI0010559BD5|nr:calcium/sodium antiporter [Legionella yabuuchiae]
MATGEGMVSWIWIISGLVFLYLGGEGLIRGSVGIAEKLQLSTLLISTVIIGFGTSAPELVVSVAAALDGYSEIAIGNIVGSNISNTMLILGLGAIIFTIPCNAPQIKLDALMGVIACLLLALLSIPGYIHRFTGFLMLLLLIVYQSFNIWKEKKLAQEETQSETKFKNQIKKEIIPTTIALPSALLLSIFSLIFLALGAHWLVKGAVTIAYQYGVSEAVIGLSLVAIGTSVPELFTVLVASWRRHPDMVIGNILGSNLFNLLSILGITSLIQPIPFTGKIAEQDVWLLLAISSFLLLVILKRKKIDRLVGLSLLLSYGLYLYWLFL